MTFSINFSNPATRRKIILLVLGLLTQVNKLRLPHQTVPMATLIPPEHGWGKRNLLTCISSPRKSARARYIYLYVLCSLNDQRNSKGSDNEFGENMGATTTACTTTKAAKQSKMEGCKVRNDRSTGLRYISGYMTGA